MSPIEERLHQRLDSLKSRDEFVSFVCLLIESFGEPPSWENSDVPSYLQSLATAAAQLERYYESPEDGEQIVDSPTWEAFAGLLFSARCMSSSSDMPRGSAT